MKTLLATTATLAILSMGPVWAQSATEPRVDEPLIEETAPGAAMPADEAPDTGTSSEMPRADAPAAMTGEATASFIGEQQDGNWLTSSLIGLDVTNPEGETLGKVAALEIGPDGQVVSVVIEAGGFLGMGARQVAVPYEAVQHVTVTPGEHQLILAATAEDLEAAPDFVTRVQKRQEEDAVRVQQEMGAGQPAVVDPANPPGAAQ
ncbi:PRC-barrel domain-containing protein [Stappia indica]|uniref:PRC-barrel domain-containing protein n=1 Tax=Stappia indica TaxID=538381 RepID=UPI001D196592|nr:PRC-barrel domain-containing protein [Stappia indica]MCC4243128.1 PRC-barrel domain-containing protein [Stappia indica]